MATIAFDNPPTIHSTNGRYNHTALVTAAPGEAVRWLHLSGQVGTRPDGTTPEDAENQIDVALQNLLAALAHHGMGPQNLVKVTSYITDRSVLAPLRAKRVAALGNTAHTLVIVAGLAAPEFLIEIEAVAAG